VSEPIKTEVAAAAGRMIRESGERVRQIAVPPTARALSTLSHIDYADAFLVEAGPARHWSAERCGRAVLDRAPLAVRTNLLLGWSAIGLKPSIGGSSRSILGWEIRLNTPEFVLLGRDSLIGMPGELLFEREHDALLFCTFVQHNTLVARAMWASIEATHVRIVRDLLGQAAPRLAP
jgi:hypothetical protein